MAIEKEKIVPEIGTIIEEKEVHQEMIIKEEEGDQGLDHNKTLAIITINKEAEVAQDKKNTLQTTMNKGKLRRYSKS